MTNERKYLHGQVSKQAHRALVNAKMDLDFNVDDILEALIMGHPGTRKALDKALGNSKPNEKQEDGE